MNLLSQKYLVVMFVQNAQEATGNTFITYRLVLPSCEMRYRMVLLSGAFKKHSPDDSLKVWLKLNKFYITIVQVTEHKKTNKIVFV